MQASGQVAIVTGGGSGLGEATARALAAHGARVAVLDLGIDRARQVAAEIGGLAVRCDVADGASAEQAVNAVAEQLGPPRILVNCAGIAIALKTVGKDGAHPLDAFRKVVEINLVGTFNMIRLFAGIAQSLEPLDGGERGVIVNTASVAAYDGQIGQTAYAASKGGIVALTLPIARELAQFGVRALAIAPGLFRTPLLAQLPQEAQDSLAVAIPFPHRLGWPEEYASLALQMVENPYLNGEVVRLDGSLRMAPR